jgi:predicted aspartyl protease
MTGTVDGYGRALLCITVRNPLTGAPLTVEAWIDTGFTSGLMLTAGQVATLGLFPTATVQGLLANGSKVAFQAYSCEIDWFGITRPIDALIGSGRFALIGVGLIEDHNLTIDYPNRTVSLVLTAVPPQIP